METLVPGQLPHRALWTATLLLWLGTGTLGISEQNLQTIINHIKPSRVTNQYAFAMSLTKTQCQDPKTQLLSSETFQQNVRDMHNVINQPGALYNPGNGNIVAARVNRLAGGQGQHSEWRLLEGGQNSPVRRLLNWTYHQNSCLIFFTLNSPCVTICLNPNSRYNITRMVRDTLRNISNNFKAFVFQQIYENESVTVQNRLDAWNRLTRDGNVPLFRCDNNGCRDCSGVNANNCL